MDNLSARFQQVRRFTVDLCQGLSEEDMLIQAMPDVSPTKWHLGHTTWFFETFLLEAHQPRYRLRDPRYRELFNSYYQTVGPQHPRPKRGLLSRPPLAEVLAWRRQVDAAMLDFIAGLAPSDPLRQVVELGLHHEQQHQELLVTDIKYNLFSNPLLPAWREGGVPDSPALGSLNWVEGRSGLVEIGDDGHDFCFDNEQPRHTVYVPPHALRQTLVSNAEYLAFIEDGGYETCVHWLSDGWDLVKRGELRAPLYWLPDGEGGWLEFTTAGPRPLDPNAPVCHVSAFEADAFAAWAGARLPTEAEWEALPGEVAEQGANLLGLGAAHPRAPADLGVGLAQRWGDVWEWTRSAYLPYPGFRPAAGALGEYNGKFMCGQWVLRGGSCATPPGHLRKTYRNFFYPAQRWQFMGIRLARDL